MFCSIKPGATIRTDDLKNLKAAWRTYGHMMLVSRFECTATLTASQRRRLPKGLQDLLVCVGSGDTESFLEAMYRLEDPR